LTAWKLTIRTQRPPGRKKIGRRIAELGQGKVKAIPWAEARQLIFGGSDDTR
jgi:hypothetical protein